MVGCRMVCGEVRKNVFKGFGVGGVGPGGQATL